MNWSARPNGGALFGRVCRGIAGECAANATLIARPASGSERHLVQREGARRAASRKGGWSGARLGLTGRDRHAPWPKEREREHAVRWGRPAKAASCDCARRAAVRRMKGTAARKPKRASRTLGPHGQRAPRARDQELSSCRRPPASAELLLANAARML